MAIRFGRRRRRFAGVLALGLLLVGGGAARAQVVDAARAALPDATRSSGVLKVATSLQWPPFAFSDERGTPDGIDIRLVKLLAGKLGLRPEFEDIKFPAIVPGVASGRYDIGVDQIGDTAERAKAVAFLDYFNSGLGLLVRKGETGIDVNHLCGHTLVLTQGSAQVGVAEAVSGWLREGRAARDRHAGVPEQRRHLPGARQRPRRRLPDGAGDRPLRRQGQRQAGDDGRRPAGPGQPCPAS